MITELSPGMFTVGTALGTLGQITKVGKGPGGAAGAWIADHTGDPQTSAGYPTFAPDWCVKVAVIGATVCPKPLFDCTCGLAHLKPADLDRLREVAAA